MISSMNRDKTQNSLSKISTTAVFYILMGESDTVILIKPSDLKFRSMFPNYWLETEL